MGHGQGRPGGSGLEGFPVVARPNKTSRHQFAKEVNQEEG